MVAVAAIAGIGTLPTRNTNTMKRQSSFLPIEDFLYLNINIPPSIYLDVIIQYLFLVYIGKYSKKLQ